MTQCSWTGPSHQPVAGEATIFVGPASEESGHRDSLPAMFPKQPWPELPGMPGPHSCSHSLPGLFGACRVCVHGAFPAGPAAIAQAGLAILTAQGKLAKGTSSE